jgi:photosynthetic reaction center H subunit
MELTMQTGAITGYIDVAQLVLYAFWIFFAALIIYLVRENKREGYPLVSGTGPVIGFPSIPAPKVFHLHDGTTRMAPRVEAPETIMGAVPTATWEGAPLEPTGDPMRDGVGPAAYAMRDEVPDMLEDGQTRIAPMRLATDFSVAEDDPDLRGCAVVGCDAAVAGTITDLWVDRAEPRIAYFEVATDAGHVLLPIGFARIGGDGGLISGMLALLQPIKFDRNGVSGPHVLVDSITAAQFRNVPGLANPDVVTRREEDRITAYFASGHLYATPDRSEPLI